MGPDHEYAPQISLSKKKETSLGSASVSPGQTRLPVSPILSRQQECVNGGLEVSNPGAHSVHEGIAEGSQAWHAIATTPRISCRNGMWQWDTCFTKVKYKRVSSK